MQGQIAQQHDIQLLSKLILEIYGGGDYSCIRMHHFRALAPKPPPPTPTGWITPGFVHVQCSSIPFYVYPNVKGLIQYNLFWDICILMIGQFILFRAWECPPMTTAQHKTVCMVSAREKILLIPVTHRPTVTGLFTLRGSKDTWTCRWYCWCLLLLLLRDEKKKEREPSSSNCWRVSSVSQGKAEVSPTSKSVGTTETEDTRISIILKSGRVCVCVRDRGTRHHQNNNPEWSDSFFSFTVGYFYNHFCVVLAGWGPLPAQFCSSAKKKGEKKTE